MIVLPYGDTAVLVEPDDATDVLALRESLEGLDGVCELVPAARTLLVRFDPRVTTAAAVEASILSLPLTRDLRTVTGSAGVEPPDIELPVRYDGADLDTVAAEVGCSARSLLERHAAGRYVVAFCGFAPGFAYLTGLDPTLQVPRLASPRTSVPAGSVAIAGEFTGVYPRASPGGWRLIGRTDSTLWDLTRSPPALLTPGTRVRFVPR